MIKMIAFFFLLAQTAYGSSLRLQNEAACPLKAIIQAADGSILHEVEVPAQKTVSWEDNSGLSPKGIKTANPKKSRTPFTVLWVCLDGDQFGVSDQIPTGSLVSTNQCSGKRLCSSSREGKNAK